MAKKRAKKKVAPSATTTVTSSKAARENLAEGTRLFAPDVRRGNSSFLFTANAVLA